jgi:TonB-linked SusC/RagA family outer membrane protein
MKTQAKLALTLLCALVMQISFAQQRAVSGIVKDNTGLPVPGVNVIIKGTTNGTQTDFDGKYTIQAAPTDVLVFSFIGMKTQEVTASSGTLNVSLADDSIELEGVVVTSLGIKREKKTLGYSTATVNNEQLTRVVNTNPFESLSGKIAGVDVSAPAQPGASPKVISRGFGSLTNNSPLYVVDGTPINNSSNGNTSIDRSFDAGSGVNDLDPNNIESMTFLKGAAATALYGSRAGRGAIIITTKKGKNQKKINVDLVSSLDMSEVARVPHLQEQFGQGWAGLGYSQLGSGPGSSNENGSWGPAFNGEVRPWGTIYNNSQQIKPYSALKDNVRDFYDAGSTQTNSVNISGGNDFSDFAMSFTDLRSDGVIPTDADRYLKRNFSVNGGLKTEKATIRASLNYVNKDQNAVNTGQGNSAGQGATLQQELLQVPTDISVVDLKDYINNPFNTPDYYFTPYATNPYFVLNENSTNIKGNNLFGNTNISYKFTPEITATWQIGGNYRSENIKSYGAKVDFTPGTPNGGELPVAGGVTESKFENSEFDTYFNLIWDKTLSEKLKLNLLGGINYNRRESNFLTASITNLNIPDYYELNNTAVDPIVNQGNTRRQTLGIYAQAELSYIEKIFFTLSSRYDTTSTLTLDNNKYFYPAASISGLLIDNGSTYLKLRGAVAQIANDNDPYLTYSSLIPGVAAANFGQITSPIGGVGFYELSGRLGNPDLKPEKTTEFEIGTEGNLFSNRITFDLSLYHRRTNDLIVNSLPLDPSTGYTVKAVNALDLVNKGIELTLGFVPVQTADFKWNFNYTFTKNDNEVVELMDGYDRLDISNPYGILFSAAKGKPLGSFYGYTPLKNDAGQYVVNPDTGFYEYGDDVQYIGSSQRDFVMGFQNTFTYKNISLSFGIDWKQGGEMYSYTKRLSHFVGNGKETTYNDRSPFIIPNSVVDNGDGTYSENTTPVGFESVTDFYNPTNNVAIEPSHVIDKTFVRLRDANITYSFPSDLVNRWGLSRFSIGVYGKNLFLWTPDDNPYVDPESTSYGSDMLSEVGEFASNPTQRTYGGFIKLSF